MSGYLPTDKHTEGDWEALGTLVQSPPHAEVMRRIAANEVPFDCKRICIVESSHYMTEEEAEANARLIASAPGGLTLARSIVWEMETFGRVSMTAYQEARNLIAKATHSEPSK